MFYEIYDGNNYILMEVKTLRNMYETKGNTIDFPTFDSWLHEMLTLGIAREVA